MSGLRYDPKRGVFTSKEQGTIGFMSRFAHEVDPSLGHTMAAGPDLLKAARQLDRLSPLIEHLVRAGAASPDYDAVVAAMRDLRAGVRKAEGAAP